MISVYYAYQLISLYIDKLIKIFVSLVCLLEVRFSSAVLPRMRTRFARAQSDTTAVRCVHGPSNTFSLDLPFSKLPF